MANRQVVRKDVEEENAEGKRLGPNAYDLNLETGDLRVTGDVIATPHRSEEEVRREASNAQREATLDQVTADLVIVGDPTLRAKDILLRLEGVGAKFEGNWIVTGVSHDIDGGGYKTTLQIRRDGVGNDSAGVVQSARPVNDLAGRDGTGDDEEVFVYNLDTGEPVGGSL